MMLLFLRRSIRCVAVGSRALSLWPSWIRVGRRLKHLRVRRNGRMLNLMYDGYLSIQTGIMRHRRHIIRGRWAILAGFIQIGMSIFVLAFVYTTFGSIIP